MTRVSEGVVFDIQGYSIHDGPGIRTTVFLSGCPLRCKWCHNPESYTAKPKLFFLAEKCAACGACMAACPHGAIALAEGALQNKRELCGACGTCVAACPHGAREISGAVMTVDEVFDRVVKDELFYASSGGGVTLSGGEVLAQPGFAAAILERCRGRGIHTTIETSGHGSWERFAAILAHTDLVYYDFKQMDAQLHRLGTGVDNTLILENAKRVYHEARKPMAARLPIITGYSDTEAHVGAAARFVAGELGADVPVHLLPYHKLGLSKHQRMEDGYIPFADQPPAEERMAQLLDCVRGYGLEAVSGG